MPRTLKENLQLLGILKEPEPAPDEVDCIDFQWWTTQQLFDYAMKHWDALSGDNQAAVRSELRKRIREAYKDAEGPETAI